MPKMRWSLPQPEMDSVSVRHAERAVRTGGTVEKNPQDRGDGVPAFPGGRGQSDKAYAWRMKGEGRIFKEQHRERVLCLECGKELAQGSLVTHHQTQHGMAKGGLG